MFFNRLSRTSHHTVDRPIFGVCLLNRDGRDLVLNTISAHDRDFLVPDVAGRWTLSDRNDVSSGVFELTSIPSDFEVDSLQSISDQLTFTSDSAGSWLDWLDVSPVPRDIGHVIDVLPLEKAIIKYCGYLEEVCCRPKAHLLVEIERVYASMARRIPAKALPYLAAHTEDWEVPTLRGVRPKRILAELRDDQFDIYENRLATRLVDHLDGYLRRRLAALRKVRRELQKLQREIEKRNNASAQVSGTYRRATRICVLWGQLIDSTAAQVKADATYREIEGLSRRIQGLMDSFLYGRIPARATVPDQPRATNILSNDNNYRKVSLLWLEWLRHGRTRNEVESPGEVYRRFQMLGHNFETFCLLLIVRSLDQLGIEPLDESLAVPVSARSGSTTYLSSGLTLSAATDGGIELGRHASILLRVVPIPATLTATAGDVVERFTRELAERKDPALLLLLHLSNQDENVKPSSFDRLRMLQTVGNEPDLTLPANFAMLPVSPWEIDSVERVSRAIQWAVLGAALRSYPCVFGPVPSDFSPAASSWLRVRGLGSERVASVLRNPTLAEIGRLYLQSAHDSAQRAVDSISSESSRISSQIAERRGRSMNEVREMMQRKAELRVERAEHEETLHALEHFVPQFLTFLQNLPAVNHCPVCPARGASTADGWAGDEGYLRFQCEDCGTEWGNRVCGSCHERIPFLELPNSRIPDFHIPGEVDRILGCDVLALPSRSETGKLGFLCSSCGELS